MISREFIVGENGVGRTLGYAGGAVDTLVRINDEKIRSFMKALDRTDFGTVGIFTLDAIFCNNVGHELVTFFTARFRGAGVADSLTDEAVLLDDVVS